MDGFVAFVVAVAVGMTSMFVLMFNVIDDDIWQQGTNGCYIHEVHENHFGADTVTITELCPVKE